MVFKLFMIEYDGEDLVFFTGVPGSKWSGVYKVLATSDEANNSDQNDGRSYVATIYDSIKNITLSRGMHAGTYYGPSNEYGEAFDDLRSMTKDQFLTELKKPYDDWNGIKILKSHWFLYDLDYILELFPKATIVGVYLPDDIAFKWWKTLGGWDIHFPNYDWFVDDKKMQGDIKEGNAYLLKFFAEKSVTMKAYTSYDILASDINLTNCNEVDYSPAALVGVYNKNKSGDSLFDKLLKQNPDTLTWFNRYRKV